MVDMPIAQRHLLLLCEDRKAYRKICGPMGGQTYRIGKIIASSDPWDMGEMNWASMGVGGCGDLVPTWRRRRLVQQV